MIRPPLAMIRIGTLPGDEHKNPVYAAAAQQAARCVTLAESVHRRRDSVSAALHATVGSCTDRGQRRYLLQLRRALFCGDVGSSRAAAASLQQEGVPIAEVAAAQIALLEELDAARATLSELFSRAELEARRTIRQCSADPAFRRALGLAAPALALHSHRYSVLPDAHRLTARDAQVERGLLRYVMRASTKATPFISFCAVAPLDTSTQVTRMPGEVASLRDLRHQAVINHALIGQLWTVLRQSPAALSSLRFWVNPTLTLTTAHLVYVQTDHGRSHVRRMQRTPVVEELVSVLRHGGTAFLSSFCDLVKSAQALEIEDGAAEQIVTHLADTGLLVADPPACDLAGDWVGSMCRQLTKATETGLNAAGREMERLSVALAGLNETYADDVRSCIDSARAAALRALEYTGAEPRLPRNLSHYEDTALSSRVGIIAPANLHVAVDTLVEWADWLFSAVGPAGQNALLEQAFGDVAPDLDAAPLIAVFSAYIERVQATQNRSSNGDQARRAEPSPAQSQEGPQLAEPLIRLRRLLAERWAQDHKAKAIRFSLEDLLECSPPSERDAATRPWESFTIFASVCQSTVCPSDLQLVLKGAALYPGYGKFFSRFLHVLPEEFGAEVRQRIRYHGEGKHCVEVAANSFFNGNVHSALTDEVLIAPDAGSAMAARAINWADVEVVRSGNRGLGFTLRRVSTGRAVMPLDLGFLSESLRPELLQFLQIFSPQQFVRAPLPTMPSPGAQVNPAIRGIDSDSATEGVARHSVVYRPRIVYGKHLVLARRSWTFHVAAPCSAEANDLPRYLEGLTKWRMMHDIPQCVYLRVLPSARRHATTSDLDSSGQTTKEGHSLEGIGDDAKPQYVDFGNPLLIKEFRRLQQKHVNAFVHCEECLPVLGAPGSELVTGHASEIVMQIDA